MQLHESPRCLRGAAIALGILLLWTLALPAPAAASPREHDDAQVDAPAPAPDAAKEQARALVIRGLRAQDDGHLDEALLCYQRAYLLVQHPELLFNLAQTHRLKGDRRTALTYYRLYLLRDFANRVTDEARAWVTQLERELTAEAVDAERAAARRRQPSASQPGEDEDEAEEGESEAAERRRRRAIAKVLGATAGASLLGAVAFKLNSRGLYHEYQKSPGGPDGAAWYHAANRQHWAATGLAITGGALALTATYLWLSTPSPDHDAAPPRLRASSLISPELTGVAVSGTF